MTKNNTFLEMVISFLCGYKTIKFSFIILVSYSSIVIPEEMMMYLELDNIKLNGYDKLVKKEIKKSLEDNLPNWQVFDYSEKYFLAIKIKDFKTYLFGKTDYYGFLGSLDLHIFLYDLEKQLVLLEEDIKGLSTCSSYNSKNIFFKSLKNAQTQIVKKFQQKIGTKGRVIAMKNDLLVVNIGKRHGIKKNIILNVFNYNSELLVRCLVKEIRNDQCTAIALEKYTKKIEIDNTIVTFKMYEAKQNYEKNILVESESDLLELSFEEKNYIVIVDNLEMSQFDAINNYFQVLEKKKIIFVNYKREIVFNDYAHELKNISIIYNVKTFSSGNPMKKIFNMAWKNFSTLECENLIIFFPTKKRKYNTNNNEIVINLKKLQKDVYKARNNILIKDIIEESDLTINNNLVNYFSKFIKKKICVFSLPSEEKFVFCYYKEDMLSKIMKVENE